MLRHLRRPLVVIVLAYAVAVGVFTIIPGIEIDGVRQYFSLFHALYVVSYTATTIGFGELPIEFSNAQRAWLIVVIHCTVVSWAYTIGSIMGLLQNPAYRHTMARRGFIKQVQAIQNPFFIICGYGETGSSLIEALIERGYSVVVLERNNDRENELILQNYPIFVPHYCADASDVNVLLEAGIEHSFCAGVMALTDSDEINRRIMVITQLWRPGLYTACRSEDTNSEAVLQDADVDLVINSFRIFSQRIKTALHTPHLSTLMEKLRTGRSHDINYLKGHWLIFGYGRFGKAVGEAMEGRDIRITVIDINPEAIANKHNALISDKMTEEAWQALVNSADGVVVGTHDDTTNMSLLMNIKRRKKNIASIVRQNHTHNKKLFERLSPNFVMDHRSIMVEEILARLTVPLLGDFFEAASKLPDDWSKMVLRIIERVLNHHHEPLHVWAQEINKRKTPAAAQWLDANKPLELRHLIYREPTAKSSKAAANKPPPMDDEAPLFAFPLLLWRNQKITLTPAFDEPLKKKDRILWVGCRQEEARILRFLQNMSLIEIEVTGKESHYSPIMRMVNTLFRSA